MTGSQGTGLLQLPPPSCIVLFIVGCPHAEACPHIEGSPNAVGCPHAVGMSTCCGNVHMSAVFQLH